MFIHFIGNVANVIIKSESFVKVIARYDGSSDWEVVLFHQEIVDGIEVCTSEHIGVGTQEYCTELFDAMLKDLRALEALSKNE